MVPMSNLHSIRTDYQGDPLPDDLTGIDPWELFDSWVQQALTSAAEPTAMILTTVDAEGRPQSRVVLLKEYSPEGLTFFTSYDSAKGKEIAANPTVGVLLWWPSNMRQIRASGVAEMVSREESEAYFAERPRSSQIGTWASSQSIAIESRQDLAWAAGEAEQRFAGRSVECPPNWGGYRVKVTELEFWQGLPHRMHDRARFEFTDGGWSPTRLAP